MADIARPLVRIRFVSELARVLREAKSGRRRLFRGQNVDKPLLPKIARLAEKKGIPYSQLADIERRMLERFRKESLPMLRAGLRPQNHWELLSIAQHQGLPTRLLDWTANALAGLWFAVATDPPDEAEHGVLWVLDVSPENEKSPSKKDDVFGLRRTYVFQPFHIDQRIVAQSAWFSVHRYTEERDKFIPLDKNPRFRGSRSRYIVPRERFGALRQELRLLGITQASMFPDLSGLCADIQAEYIDSWRPLATI